MTKTIKTTYKHNKAFYDKQYSKYVELYEDAKYAERLKGYGMLSSKMSRANFENAYQIYMDTARETGKYSKSIVGDIVRDQRYGLKRNAAAAFARATQKLPAGKRKSLDEVMHMGSKEIAELYNSELSQAYYDAVAGGMTPKSAQLWVSQVWFGSK